MHTPGHGDQATAWIFYGDGQGRFRKEIITTGMGHYESRVDDLDGDGDLADTAGAARHAPDQLMRAETKLQAAIQAKAHDRARVLAERAMGNAWVAPVEAPAAQSQASADRLRQRVENRQGARSSL